MPGKAKSLGTDRLSLAERVMLAGDIWDSIAAEADALEVPPSHKDELDLGLPTSTPIRVPVRLGRMLKPACGNSKKKWRV